MINVTDLNGNNIEVSDLDEAIVITEDRKDYCHVNEGFERFDKKQSIYWTDLYLKLITIRDQQ
jgi:hypothetical protein